MTPDTTDFNSLSKKQLVELVIAKYNDCSRLEEENKKLKDSNTILKKGWQVVFTLEKRIDELLEENKKLKEELEEVKNDLEHRDSFFSIMWDVLANEEISNEELASILYCVIHFECGDTDMSKKEVEIAEKFWYRDYV